MRKRGLVIFVVLLLLLSKSCNRSDIKTLSYNVLNEYVTAYSGGIVSRISDIHLELTASRAAQMKDKKPLKDWFSIKPRHKGELTWKDGRTLMFKPDKPLKAGEQYNISWDLSKMLGQKVPEFAYTLHTLKQDMHMATREIKTYSGQTYNINGTIHFRDFVEAEDIKELVQAKTADDDLEVMLVKPRASGYIKQLGWEVKNLERKEGANAVTISWDGGELGIASHGQEKYVLPAANTFQVVDVKTYNSPNQHISVWFSDPLSKQQNLQGLAGLEHTRVSTMIDGNVLHVYPEELLEGNTRLHLAEGIQSTNGKVFKQDIRRDIRFSPKEPGVRLLKQGVVLPSSKDGLLLPFETVNLAAVDVFITRIYANNIPQFLQVNDMDGKRELQRVGKNIIRKTVRLEGVEDYNQWTRHHLNLNELFDAEQGAVYRVALGYRMGHSTYNCNNEADPGEFEGKTFSTPEEEHPYWQVFERGYFPYSYRYVDDYWQQRDNPCHKAYYRNMQPVAQNLLATDMGILAQRSRNNTMQVLVTDLLKARPLEQVEVVLQDYQQQEIAKSTTNSKGIAAFEDAGDAFLAIARNGSEKSYLKLGAATQQNLSNYAIGGREVQKGLKGFIYGERGVWRPGDSLHISFILQEEEAGKLPEDHPLILEFYAPGGELMDKQVQKKNAANFYVFPLHTAPDAPTGRWKVTVEAGGATFTKMLRIETVKPNRLKVNLSFDHEPLVEPEHTGVNLQARWLHGAIASGMKAKVELSLQKAAEAFPGWKAFTFSDTYKDYNMQTHTVFEGETDEQGKAGFKASIGAAEHAPGVMKGFFFTKVFEAGGNFSVDQTEVTYHPFPYYVGFEKPESNRRRGSLLTDKVYNILLQTLDYKGQRASNRRVRAELYKLDWRWWWESDRNRYNYANQLQRQLVKSETFTTAQDGKTSWPVKIDEDDWGRYLLRFVDTQSGHVASQELYFSYPGWWRDMHSHFPGAAARLSLSLEKDHYNVGETAAVVFKGGKGARAFVSIENGAEVLQTGWTTATEEKNRYTFNVTREMAPNIYVHVNLIQPHSNTVNDLPIRMYGIVPAGVEEPTTHLHPQLDMPDELETGKAFPVTVSERDNRPMTYTLAVVDEGLLDLTNFATPDPWRHFFAKEALGVETWDMYNWVVGAYGGKLGNEIKLGGDMRLRDRGGRDANRFKSVVKFLGPFTLDGSSRTHQLQINDYIGSVRTMVVAGHDKAYGHAGKSTPVTSPLMVLGTLPRVLGPGEEVSLPVSVFAYKDGIRNANVRVTTNDMLEVSGASEKQVNFAGKNEQETAFRLTVKERTGLAKVTVHAQSGQYQTEYQVELDVRNPNPYETHLQEAILEDGETMKQTVTARGVRGTNTAALEVSALPALNLEQRMDYLLRYPHGCVEQVVSSAFPQLYLNGLTELSDEDQGRIEKHVKEAIKRLRSFQDNDGGMMYWPGARSISEWGTNYAGHFLLAARKKGYAVPDAMMEKWKDYQVAKARGWVPGAEHEAYIQAYRLYTLALGGNALSGPMNRLFNNSDINKQTKWRLAAAYALAGKERTADKVVQDINTQVADYRQPGRTYGSALRDKAMIVETLLLLNRRKEAFSVLKDVAKELGSGKWLSTQETAYSLIAASLFAENMQGKPLAFSYTAGDKKGQVKIKSPVKVVDFNISPDEPAGVSLTNEAGQVLFARVITRGKPEVGAESNAFNNLTVKRNFYMPSGEPVKPGRLEQGMDFYAGVTVTNTHNTRDYEEMVLSQVFPSGWEIINQRMFTVSSSFTQSAYEYRDIRDDRVYTYFDLRRGEQKTFYVLLNASYAGVFYMPAVSASAMYDDAIFGRVKGKTVKVVPNE